MKLLDCTFLRGQGFSKSPLTVLLFAVTSLGAGLTNADEVVVPNSLEGVPGNSFSCIPLTGCEKAFRYQQVFDRSEFSGIGTVKITGMRFRPDEGRRPFEFHLITDVEITLGIAATTVENPNLSLTFDDNFVAGSEVVRTGELSLEASGPEEFNIVIDDKDLSKELFRTVRTLSKCVAEKLESPLP